MKKLWWLLALFVVATAVKDGFDRIGPLAQAYRAYREQAEAVARSKGGDARFRELGGHVTQVDYRLESAERTGEDRVRLVVVESLRFQKSSDMRPFGHRRVVVSVRQHVVMTRHGGAWRVSELVEEEPELLELGGPSPPSSR